MERKAMFTLKTARELNGYTQEEACTLLGVSKDCVSNWERGKAYPDVPKIRKIEEVYGIPYDQLLFLPIDYDKIVNKV